MKTAGGLSSMVRFYPRFNLEVLKTRECLPCFLDEGFSIRATYVILLQVSSLAAYHFILVRAGTTVSLYLFILEVRLSSL